MQIFINKHISSELINLNGEWYKMAELLVVRSKIKEYAKGMNVSGDFAEALSGKVERLIQEAVTRAKANKRSTIQSRDL